MKKNIFYLLLGFVYIITSIIMTYRALATDKCSGPAYTDRPGLVAECLHQQGVNHDDPYPISVTPEPYPAPVVTVEPIPTSTPWPASNPTESPDMAPQLVPTWPPAPAFLP